MYLFLQRFFQDQQFKKYAKNDFFVTGESFGGHYVPSVSHHIWNNNKKLNNKTNYPFMTVFQKINLKGMAIGNGWIDPYIQNQWYAAMAYQPKNGRFKPSTKPIITEAMYITMKSNLPDCTTQTKQCLKTKNETLCSDAFEQCFQTQEENVLTPTGLNMYDITKRWITENAYNDTLSINFMNRKDVQVGRILPKEDFLLWSSSKIDVGASLGTLLPIFNYFY